MSLIDAGNGKDLEFGHTDYLTGEGRGVTHSQNEKERYINPELSVKERNRISTRDSFRRNKTTISLLAENNTQIEAEVYYNPFTEALSLSIRIRGNNGKRVFRLN